MALAAEKGTDFKKLNQKKKAKEAAKLKPQTEDVAESEEGNAEKAEEQSSEGEEQTDGEEDEANDVYLEGIDDSDTSDSSVDMEERLPRKPTNKAAAAIAKDDDEDEEEDEDEEDIPVSDLEDLDDEDKEDLIPHTRLTINNTTALLSALSRIALPSDKSIPFSTHQSVLADTETEASIPDVSDDLQRELAFYSQGLDAVRQARTKLRAEKVPFSRPGDYFAEMVKEDAHMERIRARLIEEASNKKASAEARKQRDLKKFGKQVQVAKLQERQKEKRETLDKIKSLKRKRQESGGDMATQEADIFDVGVEKELGKPGRRGDKDGKNNRSGPGRGAGAGGAQKGKRQKKDEKYGFGGKKRHGKSGDAVSSSDLSGFDPKRMKAGGRVSKPSRPGKNRRKTMSTR